MLGRRVDRVLAVLQSGGFSLEMSHHALHVLGSRMLGFTQDPFDDSTDQGAPPNPEAVAQMFAAFPNVAQLAIAGYSTIVLLPLFTARRYIEAIGRYRCTVISGVPTMMAMLLTRKDLLAKIDASSVRTVMMGSAPSSPPLIAEVKTHFPNAEALVVYGVTEGCPVPLSGLRLLTVTYWGFDGHTHRGQSPRHKRWC